MAVDFHNVHLEVGEGVARITLDRPPLNVLNIEAMKEINQVLAGLTGDTTAKLVIITGKGRAFSVGVDIKDHTADRAEEMIAVFHRMFHLLASLPQPTVAVVNGPALGGGCELALFCDLVIASEAAQFGQPEIKAGVFPPIAALLLPRIMGRKQALELLLTGEAISAQEAWRLGLVNHVALGDRLAEEANQLVQKLMGLSGAVLRITKRAVKQGLDADFQEVLQKMETIYFQELMKTEDAHEGLQAFLEKRSPMWKDR
ncbi:MAG: enoyl-CoA hydratase/isomerase family protein [Chloroflexi bacterium]|nr:enoyl-CoA hydratase/isomerase family protein [Chloroflexota bacterium]